MVLAHCTRTLNTGSGSRISYLGYIQHLAYGENMDEYLRNESSEGEGIEKLRSELF